MMEPLVSILLPIHDAQTTLGPSLRSLQRQTLEAWECIAVDDGSSDASLALCRGFARSDPRIRVFDRPHRGIVQALRHGLEHCRAPLVARMDADDLMHRRRLEAQLAALDAQPELAAVGCHVRLFPRTTLQDGMREYEKWLAGIDDPESVRREAFIECPIAHPTLMIRTEILVEFGYRERGWPEDYDLILRLLERKNRLAVVPERLLSWRKTETSLIRTHPAYSQDRITACKAEFLARGFLAARDNYVLWGYGGTGRSLQRALRSHGKKPSAIVEVHPGRIGNRIQDAPVIAPDALIHRRDQPVVVSVAGASARQIIRNALRELGFEELRDYVCAA